MARVISWAHSSGADRLVRRGSDTFSYDPLGRLVSASAGVADPPNAGDPPRTLTATYAYDGDGLLRSRMLSGDAHRPGHRHDDEDDDRQTTAFLWDTSTAPAPLLAAGTDRVVHGLGPLYYVRPGGRTTMLVPLPDGPASRLRRTGSNLLIVRLDRLGLRRR